MKANSMEIESKNVVLPEALEEGATIGIVAPAGPFDLRRFNKGLGAIDGMGFATKLGEDLYRRNGYLAGEDAHRAEQFNTMVADDTVQAVMCARGGYGVLRILDQLDYDAIVKHPKPIIGFSDITALHRAINLRTGLISFHGPMVTTIKGADKASRCSWRDTLMGRCDVSALLAGVRVLKSGVAEGILTGGNLATLCHMVGTSFCGDYAGTVLLIEDVGEAPYRIDRMLTQMKMAGVFDGLAGILMGSFEKCGSADEIDAVVLERFEDMDIPIVSGIPVGHGRANLTVPLGAPVRLDAQLLELTLSASVFQE